MRGIIIFILLTAIVLLVAVVVDMEFNMSRKMLDILQAKTNMTEIKTAASKVGRYVDHYVNYTEIAFIVAAISITAGFVLSYTIQVLRESR